MDIVTDLTAQAVSFLTVYQDFCKSKLSVELKVQADKVSLWEMIKEFPILSHELSKQQEQHVREIMWTGVTLDKNDLSSHFFNITEELITWLGTNVPLIIDEKLTVFSSPFSIRQTIRPVLYQFPGERLKLADILNYLPLQIVLALGVKNIYTLQTGYAQRLYQVWGKSAGELVGNDLKIWNDWWNHPYPEKLLDSETNNLSIKNDDHWESVFDEIRPRKEQVNRLIEDDRRVLAQLNAEEVAVPFETFFAQELDEIDDNRKLRWLDGDLPMLWPVEKDKVSEGKDKDPLERASNMQLAGLSLSGGGIRSATFNLGLLQKLAELNVLNRFDYLSTVSGGGYIGSWLVSWISRATSISKVTERLNPRKSADPSAEEVRPIRWLRMFSNYLSPNASIMSDDAWTSGITWVRNTVINQGILLLLLCSVLSAITLCFDIWRIIESGNNSLAWERVLLWSLGILLIGSVLAGYGMRAYGQSRKPIKKFRLGISGSLALLLILWGTVACFFISAWLYKNISEKHSFGDNVISLSPAALSSFVGMFAIALIGLYGKDVKGKTNKQIKLWIGVIFSSFFASITGLFLLACSWEVFRLFTCLSYPIYNYRERLVFITGIPLILETISICVVIRMVIMGKLFSDERREWWGRTGGIVHRFILFWFLVTTCALIIPEWFQNIDYSKVKAVPALLGGWAAIIGYAVKLAYNAKTSGDKPANGSVGISEVFVRFAPYLFMIGFLLIGAFTLEHINSAIKPLFLLIRAFTLDHIKSSVILFDWVNYHKNWACFIVTLLLFGLTFFLSWRTGVNEFSLHHFYRNRLTRAYLGATRRRTDRESTANSFTGFDKLDDFAIASLRAENSYSGPYPIINTALNATTGEELDRQDRKAESFIFSPLYCGFDFSPTRSASYAPNGILKYGYRPTEEYSTLGGPLLGSAMAISGAAVSPNMGYHSSPATAFLLTMFNVRLTKWIGNPRLSKWKDSDPKSGLAYLVKDLIGSSDIDSDYVCLSDGGHFDNMGVYELIRRKCTYILVGDAEQDEQASCEGLANAIRRCRIDFGVEINLDVSRIVNKDKTSGFAKAHLVKGTIWYPGEKKPTGKIIYVKSALTGNESVDIRQYHMNNPKFPQQSTGDQFFDESQFESYRRLGYHSIKDVNQIR